MQFRYFQSLIYGLVLTVFFGVLGMACWFDFNEDNRTASSVTERLPQSIDPSLEGVTVSFKFGENLPEAIRLRLSSLITSTFTEVTENSCPTTSSRHLHLQFGYVSDGPISLSEKRALKTNEGFIIKAQKGRLPHCLTLAADGKATERLDFKSARGASYGAYAVMQDLGFRFLHPLKPQNDSITLDFAKLEKLSRTEEPRWETRAMHLHTMHPLELTNLVNGWGLRGPQDLSGWEEMLPYWTYFMEWMTAHKQNEVEWMLLWSPEAGSYNQSAERQNRLKRLTTLSKNWGVDVGAVTPVRFVQQNGWTLLRNHESRKGQPNEERQNINEILHNINWLLQAGFTAIGGELGEGEFSSAPAANTIQELNAIADHLAAQNPKVPYRVKVHVSQKQYAKGYQDPMTRKDINFNYLPLYTNSNVGVLPHTIQIYSLDDPAPTYENENFMDMFRFIKMAATGAVEGRRREVLFYPETSYWVSYDIDVPLFLPVYAYRRVHDLRMIARDETYGEMKRKNAHIHGQVIFSSGWEWGYWFNDVITAEAAWNPRLNAGSSALAFQEIIRDTLRLDEKIDGRSSGLAQLISSISQNQHRLLILGQHSNARPQSIEKRNGMAYMAGVDSFDEIGMWTRENLPAPLKTAVPLTQPNKFRDDWAFQLGHLFYLNESKYNSELKPLLKAMSSTFQQDARRIQGFKEQSTIKGLEFFLQEFTDGAHINSLRAAFVFNIYEARLARAKNKPASEMNAFFSSLDRLLQTGRQITDRRKSLIPMQPAHRKLVTAWEAADSKNPTDYRFGYLWTAYNLFYWQRELNKLRFVEDDKSNFCYMNIIKASDLEGKINGPTQQAESFARMAPYFRSCASIPTSEPNLQRGW